MLTLCRRCAYVTAHKRMPCSTIPQLHRYGLGELTDAQVYQLSEGESGYHLSQLLLPREGRGHTAKRYTMQDVKKRLAAYRQQKELKRPPVPGRLEGEREKEEEEEQDVTEEVSQLAEGSRIPQLVSEQTPQSDLPKPSSAGSTSLYVTLLKAVLWILLWGFFIEVGFGAVFLVTSVLFFIIVSLRGSRRKPWEPSAYSVFNRNFEAIEGTLSAEQFERELRYGPLSVKK